MRGSLPSPAWWITSLQQLGPPLHVFQKVVGLADHSDVRWVATPGPTHPWLERLRTGQRREARFDSSIQTIAHRSWAFAPATWHSLRPLEIVNPHTMQLFLPAAVRASESAVGAFRSTPSRSRSRTIRRISASGSSGDMTPHTWFLSDGPQEPPALPTHAHRSALRSRRNGVRSTRIVTHGYPSLPMLGECKGCVTVLQRLGSAGRRASS